MVNLNFENYTIYEIIEFFMIEHYNISITKQHFILFDDLFIIINDIPKIIQTLRTKTLKNDENENEKIEIDDSQINIVIERLKNPLLYTTQQVIRLFNLSEPLERFEVHSSINQYRQKFIELSSMKKYKNLSTKEIHDFMNEVSEKLNNYIKQQKSVFNNYAERDYINPANMKILKKQIIIDTNIYAIEKSLQDDFTSDTDFNPSIFDGTLNDTIKNVISIKITDFEIPRYNWTIQNTQPLFFYVHIDSTTNPIKIDATYSDNINKIIKSINTSLLSKDELCTDNIDGSKKCDIVFQYNSDDNTIQIIINSNRTDIKRIVFFDKNDNLFVNKDISYNNELKLHKFNSLGFLLGCRKDDDFIVDVFPDHSIRPTIDPTKPIINTIEFDYDNTLLINGISHSSFNINKHTFFKNGKYNFKFVMKPQVQTFFNQKYNIYNEANYKFDVSFGLYLPSDSLGDNDICYNSSLFTLTDPIQKSDSFSSYDLSYQYFNTIHDLSFVIDISHNFDTTKTQPSNIHYDISSSIYSFSYPYNPNHQYLTFYSQIDNTSRVEGVFDSTNNNLQLTIPNEIYDTELKYIYIFLDDHHTSTISKFVTMDTGETFFNLPSYYNCNIDDIFPKVDKDTGAYNGLSRIKAQQILAIKNTKKKFKANRYNFNTSNIIARISTQTISRDGNRYITNLNTDTKQFIREYNQGPIDIEKLTIKIVDPFGNDILFNNGWSMNIEVEYLNSKDILKHKIYSTNDNILEDYANPNTYNTIRKSYDK